MMWPIQYVQRTPPLRTYVPIQFDFGNDYSHPIDFSYFDCHCVYVLLVNIPTMPLLGLLLNPVRTLLGSTIRAVFEPDVRQNPTIVNANFQSDDRDNRLNKEELYGFAPQYVVPLRRPRTDVEAQRLYNHIRTTSWYLDAIPLLGRKLPFNVGIDVSPFSFCQSSF